jgi:hypothetical protein
MPHEKNISREMRQCAEECLSCASICTEAVPHCLLLGGRHAMADHIGSLIDCAQICQTSADFMLRGSHAHTEVCGVCATVCRTCEASCRELADDELMKRCADECARCAESCERMAGAAAR